MVQHCTIQILTMVQIKIYYFLLFIRLITYHFTVICHQHTDVISYHHTDFDYLFILFF